MINRGEALLSPPNIKHTREEEIQIIHISGKLTYGTTNHAKEAIHKALDETVKGYIIDMSNTEYIDSTGFGVLINFAKMIGEKDRSMAIIVTDPLINQLFTISKFHLVFPIVKTKEEALKVLREGFDSSLLLQDY